MIRNYIQWLVGTYAYNDVKEFLLSLFPSFKYGIQGLTISLSFFAAVINEFIGIGPALAVAMLVAVLVETWTGIYASRKRGEKFQSFKFSRCVIKIAVWYSLLYFTHSFSSDCAAHTGIGYLFAVYFFNFIQILILAYFAIEYMTSILENFAVIDGKPKDNLINAMKDSWQILLDKFKKQ